MARKALHVIPHGNGWVVQQQGSHVRATLVLRTRDEAIEKARQQARQVNGEVVVHNRNGAIRDNESFTANRVVTLPRIKPKHLSRSSIRSAVSKKK